MKAAGIDLAGVVSRPTGLCLMDDTLHFASCLVYTDAETLARMEGWAPDVVAIDAPLALPRGRASLAKGSNIHLRECDRELLRMGIKFFPLTIGPMRQLTERGIRLRAALEKQGMKVIETYPGAAQDILHIPRKGKGREKLAEGLNRMGIKGVTAGLSADELDAITCAYVGILFLKGEYQALGDPEEILLILPLS
ncbi:MAG: DUF429 domain-containing protein [Chloroflexi bacterium]|nr:DUF429 domain-containing protein [Chloroflexota bacterium]